MITNPLLEEKYHVQRQLAEEAGYDVRKYHQNLRQEIVKMQKSQGIKLRYVEDLSQERTECSE